VESFATEAEAKAFAEAARLKAPPGGEPTIDDALDEYELYMRNGKGNKQNSVSATIRRLKGFIPNREREIARCPTAMEMMRRYDARVEEVATDTHRNELSEAKTFFNFCIKRRHREDNPVAEIEGKGRRRKGKEQLRISEARVMYQGLLPKVETDDAALATTMLLTMGMRQSEITLRVVRDVDDGGSVFWVPEAKTDAGQRWLEVPEALRPALLKRITGRQPTEVLFPGKKGKPHRKEWLNKNVKRFCRELGLPVVTAHGLRGTCSTLSKEAGQTAHAVAAQLGHADPRVTREHYEAPGTEERSMMRRTLRLVEGGKKNAPQDGRPAGQELVTETEVGNVTSDGRG